MQGVTSLRTLQAGIYDNSHLIKNLFSLPKKNLGSFTRVSTVLADDSAENTRVLGKYL